MPAHTKPSDVGVVSLSNGQRLTAKDRLANDAADHLAKRGAQTHRIPAWLRKSIKKHELLAVWAARTLAIATHASNNLVVAGKEGMQRDSTGLPPWKRKNAKPSAPKPAEALTQPTEGVALPPPAPLVKPTPHAKKVVDSSDSSEEDLTALERSCTARSQKAKQKKASADCTATVIRSISCFAVPDENEATAPHRMRHLKARMVRRAAYEAAALYRPSAESGGAAPTSASTEAALSTSLPGSSSLSPPCDSTPLQLAGASQSSNAEPPSGQRLPHGEVAAPAEQALRMDLCSRPRKLLSHSRAAAEKATAGAIASLLS